MVNSMSLPPPPPPLGPQPPPPAYVPYQPNTPALTFASWASRVGGLLINSLVGAGFCLPAIVALFAVPKELTECTIDGEASLCELPTSTGWIIIGGLAVLGIVTYLWLYCSMIAKSGQAWGHKAVGIKIIDSRDYATIGRAKAFFRHIVGHSIDGLPAYLGYLWPLWDKQKQTFADKIFSTYSVKV
jgi:uncharacterized RDD family membrane protein YckC